MSVDQILVLGVNHKTAPVEVREKLAFPDIEIPLAKLSEIPGCTEFCFLSTCNRVEVIFTSSSPEKTVRHIRSFLFADSNLNNDEATNYTYQLWIIHQLERIGDRVTNIAESIVFLSTGKVVNFD